MLITSASRVDDILRRVPGASHLFVTWHTACVGCHLARFCTLEDVATHYHLDVATLVAALQERVPALPANEADRAGQSG